MDEKLIELIKTASGGNTEITPDTNLALDLGLKSIDLLELVTDVEDTFGIEVSDEAVETIHTAGELSKAVRAGIGGGFSDFYLCLSEELYREMMADPSRLSRAVRDGGFKDSWSYYHWDERFSVYIVSE